MGLREVKVTEFQLWVVLRNQRSGRCFRAFSGKLLGRSSSVRSFALGALPGTGWMARVWASASSLRLSRYRWSACAR